MTKQLWCPRTLCMHVLSSWGTQPSRVPAWVLKTNHYIAIVLDWTMVFYYMWTLWQIQQCMFAFQQLQFFCQNIEIHQVTRAAAFNKGHNFDNFASQIPDTDHGWSCPNSLGEVFQVQELQMAKRFRFKMAYFMLDLGHGYMGRVCPFGNPYRYQKPFTSLSAWALKRDDV